MLEQGNAAARVIEFFSEFFPKAVARRYVDQARFNITREKIRKAKESVIAGSKTTRQAAEEFGVDIETLKQELSGKKKNKKKTEVREFKSALTTQFRSHGQKWSSQLAKLRAAYENEDVDSNNVLEVLEHLEHLMMQAQRSFKNGKDRIMKMVG
jgi:spore coat polysaccharide biosynthesis protein SpsF (cytidylyltransferase family)